MRYRWRARFVRRRGLLAWVVLAAALAVMCAGTVGAAGSAGADSEGVVPVGAAPVWPFRGVVNSVGNLLEYRDAETGAVSGVRLGGFQGCQGQVANNEDYVEVASWSPGGVGGAILRVPWGDEAYPYFAPSEDVPLRYFGRARDVGVEVSTVPEGFRVATAEGEAYYRRSDDVGLRLVRTGDSLEEHLEAVGVDPDEDYEYWWHYYVELDGTDGYHYGFWLVHPEPNCPFEEGFIVAGDTGEVVACGSGQWGALLVLPEGEPRVVGRFALPRSGGDCDLYEAWRVGSGGLSLSAGSGG